MLAAERAVQVALWIVLARSLRQPGEQRRLGDAQAVDVDVQGGTALLASYPQAVSIFLLPPSHGAMEARLRKRGTESGAGIARRLAEALNELDSVTQYEYVIVNRELDKTVEVFSRIIHAEEHRRIRRENLDEWIDVHFPERAGTASVRASS